MTVEVSLKSTLDATIVNGPFIAFIGELNLAAAQGKQYVIAMERRPDGSTAQVAFETRNITRIRDLDDENSAYIGM